MRLPRPKSLSGLMLIGFTVVAAPLLFAIVDAALQMNRMSSRSEQLVVRGVQGTRNNQRMFVEIASLERSARLYQILPNNELLEGYARNQLLLENTLDELLALPLDAQAQSDVRELRADAERAAMELKAAAPNSSRMTDLVNSYPQMSDLANRISTRVSGQIDNELSALQSSAELAQRKLFWRTMLLMLFVQPCTLQLPPLPAPGHLQQDCPGWPTRPGEGTPTNRQRSPPSSPAPGF